MRYRDAHALAAAIEALDSIIARDGYLAFGDDNAGGHGRLAGAATSARNQLTAVLIVAKVWTNDEVAGGVLNAD